MKKKYRIIVDSEKHRDIYEQLESIPRALRGEFIRIAIRLLMNNTTPMNNLRIETVLKIIPSSEAWLYKNKQALESVQNGLKTGGKGQNKKAES